MATRPPTASQGSSPIDTGWPLRALDGLSPTPFWLDSSLAPVTEAPLTGSVECDLAVVGAGYHGLWTALLAKERDPSREVVVLEAGRLGWQASGRNGGFCMATLTHGLANNEARWPGDLERLTQAGIRNLQEMRAGAGRDVAAPRAGVVLDTPAGEVRAAQAVLATNAFPALIRRLRFYTVPVYDYALMTEPLSDEQLASIGWKNRQGLADAGVFFHYFRISEDRRILWGGWDGIYHWRNRIRPEYDQRRVTFELLSRQFFAMFPQLQGLRFTHGWGGVIDVCSRFTAFYGTAMGGRVAYGLGFTGQGVALVRFAANVCLDLLAGEKTERTALPIVGSKPIPWPPEPLRAGAIALTQRSMQRAQDNGGDRDLWLRTLDRFDLGFDT
jgi:glycine/D-amino acid oxidase-like deaminating enzyme